MVNVKGTAADVDGSKEPEVQCGPPGESAEPPHDGFWPTCWSKFANDFRRAKNAKASDGLLAPPFDSSEWEALSGAGTEVVLEATRRRHDQAEARIARAEERATRITQTALTLLTVAFVVAYFEADRLRAIGAPWVVWPLFLVLPVATFVSLAIAVIESLGVDRVGYVWPADPRAAAALTEQEAQRCNLTVQEARASFAANWTAGHKLDEVLQARAWLTRGITTLILTYVFAAGLWFLTPETPRAPAHNAAAATPTSSPCLTPPPTHPLRPAPTPQRDKGNE